MRLIDKQLNVPEKILKMKDFNDTFELVKLAVNSKFNMHRAGLKPHSPRLA